VTEAAARGPWLAAAEAALAGGSQALQLREKDLDDHELTDRARALRALCTRHGALLIINDRPDIAARVQADGVHVGQEDATVSQARRVLRPNQFVGLSTHSIEQVRRALRDPPDYLAVGPMFPSSTKPQSDIPGPALLDAARALTDLPLVAIGGITPATAPRLRNADGLAVCHAVLGADDPLRAARELLEAFSGQRGTLTEPAAGR
jgi:thiamine-phosphate pyrophosphorylase